MLPACLPACGVGSRPDLPSVTLKRNVEGLLSLLLSLKKRPSQIRYQGTSPAARQVPPTTYRLPASQAQTDRQQTDS